MNYRYYSTQRPIMPGSYPKPEGNGIVYTTSTIKLMQRKFRERRGVILSTQDR